MSNETENKSINQSIMHSKVIADYRHISMNEFPMSRYKPFHVRLPNCRAPRFFALLAVRRNADSLELGAKRPSPAIE